VKPIFNEEKLFFEKRTGITLPNNCWRDGSKIYLNSDSEKSLIQFKVEKKEILITKNIIKDIYENLISVEYKKGNKLMQETWIKKNIEEEININYERLHSLYGESIIMTKKYILTHPDHELRPSISGGKDSDVEFEVLMEVFRQLVVESKNINKMIYKYKELNLTKDTILKVVNNIENYLIDFFNVTNDTAQTYLHIKNDFPKDKLRIHNPKKGWHMWLKEDKNYFIPSATVRNCCSTYKEGQVKKVLDKNKKYIMFLGARKFESTKRQDYDWDLTEAYEKMGKESNMPKNWRRFLPIVNWKDEDIWLWILHRKSKFNYMYKLGFNRCGCLICPFQSDYIDVLTREYYPLQWSRWEDILEKNYERTDVANRLKWTLEEWKQGAWKQGMSKEQYLIQNKATPERINELAEIKGISEELAEKYFQKKCSCGKKLNPDEVAINLKTYGRGMDVGKMQCKKCFCEDNNITGKDYQDKVHNFRNDGCNLF
jgi:3'-phosphoadenosine 5'-phosphosulfate sulfotransferase (PAPS reductase)/FAD synthetase